METMDTLQKIIQPQYLEHFADWEKFANEKERKGLKLVASIYKHKGLKKFRADPPSKQLESFQKSNTIDYKKAEELYRKNQITSSYSSEFGSAVKESKPQTNIFRYQKCSETEFKNVLTKLTVQFLDNWIELQDEAEFQDLVLLCLRSLNARYKSIQVGKSEAKSQFNWNVDWKLCKPIRIDKIGADYRSIKTDYNAIFKDTLKKEQEEEQLQNQEEGASTQ